MEEKKEKALLVGLNITSTARKIDDIDINESMEELKELAKAAGAEVVGSLIQNRQSRDAAFYVGKGKVEEIKAYSDSLGATVVIFNDELSGAHIRNIEEVVGIKVIDRTTLILDIFAQRALSKEGKLQVELAQLNYRLPRLYGMGGQMSRTGAGIGTRGPGEQKLEIDKRNILNKAADIRRELREVKKIRETQRVQRLKSSIPIVALVGYTNAGKSTLLNELIKTHKDYDVEKEVMAKDMLFATLDVTLRKALLPNKKEFLVVDTVGFVSKLPHDLVEAFKATLEEVQYADLILHVIDATNSNYELQKSTTEKVLKELGADTKPTILVYNKIDRLELDIYPKNHDDIVYISAKKGINMDKLIEIIQDNIMKNTYAVTLMLPYERGDIFSRLKNKYNIENLEDYYITYLLYKESRTVSQISKIRNLSTSQVNDQLIKAKLEIKSMLKDKVELSKDVIDKFLVLNKNDRLKFMDSLNEERMLDFKRKLYKRIITEKNAEDLMILIWATGELKDDRFLALLHPLTSHRHSDVRRITYSALRKIESPSSREYLQRGLYDSNPQTRQYCAKALAKIGNKNSLKMLKQLRNKKNFEKEYVLRAYEEAISILEEDI